MRKFKACYAKQYRDGQGQDKTSWKTLGFANEIVAQDGKVTIHLTLDAMPTGQWDGEIKLFLQDENNNANQQSTQQSYQQPQQQSYQQPPIQYVDANGNPIKQQ